MWFSKKPCQRIWNDNKCLLLDKNQVICSKLEYDSKYFVMFFFKGNFYSLKKPTSGLFLLFKRKRLNDFISRKEKKRKIKWKKEKTLNELVAQTFGKRLSCVPFSLSFKIRLLPSRHLHSGTWPLHPVYWADSATSYSWSLLVF